MQLIDSSNIIPIIKSALNLVDPRLMNHGDHVSYLLEKMLMKKGGYSSKQVYDICLLGLLHDIGAYKTEEIDDLISFDVRPAWNHAVYGFQFLSYLSPMKVLAPAVKYHHLNYCDFTEGDPVWREIALLIKLTDRVDVVLNGSNNPALVIKMLKNDNNAKFDKAQVDWFLETQAEFHLLEHLLDNSYTNEQTVNLHHNFLSQEEIEDYLKMIALSIDFRSKFTVVHTITTVSLSTAIARHMGLDGETVHKIHMGALLHDIGKLAIPISILEKPAGLTNEEMLIMKTHVSKTEEVLEHFIDPEVCRIASRHHEKLDGSGYPHGLTEAQMTLPEMIVAVADIMSALHSRRSYKAPFSKDVLTRELLNLSRLGKLSPQVVAVCVENYDALIEETKRNCEQVTKMYERFHDEYEIMISAFANHQYF